MKNDVELLTVKEAAEIAKVKPRTVYEWIYRRNLKAQKAETGTIRIPKETLLSFLNCTVNNKQTAE